MEGAQEGPGPLELPTYAQTHCHGQVSVHLRLSRALILLFEYARGFFDTLRRCADYTVDVLFSLVHEFDMQGFTCPQADTVSNSVQHVKLLSLSCVLSPTCPVFLSPLLPSSPLPSPISLFFFSYKKMLFYTNSSFKWTLGFLFPLEI